MRFERVHTIREVWDGVRSGTADFEGVPHYFASLFDDAADDWTEHFRLYPVTTEFMEREKRCWTIFRAWEAKFHDGFAPSETHPGYRGIVPEYDALNDWLDQCIKTLEPLTTCFSAMFRQRAGQDNLPGGILRELDVAWTSVAP